MYIVCNIYFLILYIYYTREYILYVYACARAHTHVHARTDTHTHTSLIEKSRSVAYLNDPLQQKSPKDISSGRLYCMGYVINDDRVTKFSVYLDIILSSSHNILLFNNIQICSYVRIIEHLYIYIYINNQIKFQESARGHSA